MIPLPRRHNLMVVEAAEFGFTVTLVTPSGYRHHFGTCDHLGEARTLASNEAFRVSRCRVEIRVQILGAGTPI